MPEALSLCEHFSIPLGLGIKQAEQDSFGSFEPIGGPAFLVCDQMPAHAPLSIFLIAKFDVAHFVRWNRGHMAAVVRLPALAVGDNYRFLSFSLHVYTTFFEISGLLAGCR